MLIDYKLLNNEELYFYYWIEELYNEGYIDYISSEQKVYSISNKTEIEWIKKTKKKESSNSFILLPERTYTVDFSFRFSKKSLNLFYYESQFPVDKRLPFINVNKDDIIYVDIKGEFTRNFTSGVTFPDRQSIVWNLYKNYIHKIIPFGKKNNRLFNKTFVPKKVQELEIYKTTTKFGKKGEVKKKFNLKNLKEYINERENIINRWE